MDGSVAIDAACIRLVGRIALPNYLCYWFLPHSILCGPAVLGCDQAHVCMSDLSEIESAIPHRKPMLLVDSIVEKSADRIVCRKHFLETEFFLQGHFPGYPLVPGVILCESVLQTGAILLAGRGPIAQALPVATRMDNVKFKQKVRPNDIVDIEVTLNEVVANAYFLTGKVTCQGKLAARLDFACALVQPE